MKTKEDWAKKWEEAQARQRELKERERQRRHKAIPKTIRKQVYDKYQGRCAYCGKPISYKEMQVDHIEPRSTGGVDGLDNYNPACRMCNFYKGDKSLEAFRQDLTKLQERLKKVYIYRLALKYRLIEEQPIDVTFHFEKEARMEQKREVLAYLQKALEAAGVNACLILSEDGKTVEFTDLAVYEPKHISVAFDSPAAMIVDVINGAAKWFVR